jgi:hypothetical protein
LPILKAKVDALIMFRQKNAVTSVVTDWFSPGGILPSGRKAWATSLLKARTR